jgi:hypothetical protein
MSLLQDFKSSLEDIQANISVAPVGKSVASPQGYQQQASVDDMMRYAGTAADEDAVKSAVNSYLSQPLQSFIKNLQDVNENTIRQLNKALSPSVADNTNATLFHGGNDFINGLFTARDVDMNIISTIVVPNGILRLLPAIGVVRRNITVSFLTGFAQDDTPEPDYPCEDGPSGTYSGCSMDFNWGRVSRCTNTMNFTELGRRLDEGDTDLRLIGSLLSSTNGRLSMANINPQDMLNVVVRSEMVGAGILFERNISRVVWIGDEANNTPHLGYAEATGLDSQITTGILDSADDLTPCPQLDSVVVDWEHADVSGTITAVGETWEIHEVLADLMHYFTRLARSTGTNEVQWVIVMKPDLWRRLTAVFPTQYETDRASDSMDANAGERLIVEARAMREMKERMRQGMYLPLNGVNYPVWLDDGIDEGSNTSDPANHTDAGEYSSTIYILPLTVANGMMQVTYIEYMDYRDNNFAREQSLLPSANLDFWTDDGVFSWALEQVKWCFKICAQTEWRVLLRTPHFAGKIENINFKPYKRTRPAHPEFEGYL